VIHFTYRDHFPSAPGVFVVAWSTTEDDLKKKTRVHHHLHTVALLPQPTKMWPFDLVDWVMLAVPIAYIVILIGSLSVFSNLYRKRQMASAAALEPWFPAHLQRNIYLSLLHQEDPKVPDNILKAALLRRATEDIHRIVKIRNEKQALQVLLQRGSVGEDLWQRFQRAEKEMEEELRDVVQEVRSSFFFTAEL
jgi:translocation protein SEC66